jgi:hypothetical protein
MQAVRGGRAGRRGPRAGRHLHAEDVSRADPRASRFKDFGKVCTYLLLKNVNIFSKLEEYLMIYMYVIFILYMEK